MRSRMSAANDAKTDVLMLGGGHNGLVCAAYLAAAGLKVRVLERRSIVGGAAVTEEFHPGFRNSVASYTVSLLNPKVIRDLRLQEHGLRVVERPYSNFLPLADGQAFRLGGEHGAADIARWSKRDVEQLPKYYAMLDRVVMVLRELMQRAPPNVSDRFVLADWLASFSAARQLKTLDMVARRDLLDLFAKSAGDLLDGWFEGEPLKAALGWDSVVGNFASPYTPGSAYVLLDHVFGEVNGKTGVWGHAIGGMGAITQAMAKECLSRGVRIDTDAEVAQVLVKGGRAVGVALADGTEITASMVVSNVNPKLLYQRLVPQERQGHPDVGELSAGLRPFQKISVVHADPRRPAECHHRRHGVPLERAGVRQLGLCHRMAELPRQFRLWPGLHRLDQSRVGRAAVSGRDQGRRLVRGAAVDRP